MEDGRKKHLCPACHRAITHLPRHLKKCGLKGGEEERVRIDCDKMLFYENKRAYNLGLVCPHVRQLHERFGDAWPIAADALRFFGVPFHFGYGIDKRLDTEERFNYYLARFGLAFNGKSYPVRVEKITSETTIAGQQRGLPLSKPQPASLSAPMPESAVEVLSSCSRSSVTLPISEDGDVCLNQDNNVGLGSPEQPTTSVVGVGVPDPSSTEVVDRPEPCTSGDNVSLSKRYNLVQDLDISLPASEQDALLQEGSRPLKQRTSALTSVDVSDLSTSEGVDIAETPTPGACQVSISVSSGGVDSDAGPAPCFMDLKEQSSSTNFEFDFPSMEYDFQTKLGNIIVSLDWFKLEQTVQQVIRSTTYNSALYFQITSKFEKQVEQKFNVNLTTRLKNTPGMLNSADPNVEFIQHCVVVAEIAKQFGSNHKVMKNPSRLEVSPRDQDQAISAHSSCPVVLSEIAPPDSSPKVEHRRSRRIKRKACQD